MNEAKLMKMLDLLYQTCQAVEDLRDYTEEYSEEDDFLVDLYDELFDKTTEIESYFGLLDD